MAILFFLVFIQIIFVCSAQEKWSYKDEENWEGFCQGNLQSPIALEREDTFEINLEEFQFSPNTYQKLDATLTNDGHSVVLRFVDDSNPLTVSGGGLEGDYILDSIHFHWLSEHTMDDYRYAVEGHFVYYAKKHENLNNALKIKGGVAVLAVFYELDDSENIAFNFVNEVSKVAHTINKPIQLTSSIIMAELLPSDLEEFYRYNGSSSTPDCNEVVLWTVFSTPSYISDEQKEDLSEIYDEDDELLESNFRDLQALNDRPVYFNY